MLAVINEEILLAQSEHVGQRDHQRVVVATKIETANAWRGCGQ